MQLYSCRHELQIMASQSYALTSVGFVCVSGGQMSLYVINFWAVFVCTFWFSISWALELEKLNDAYYSLSL